MTAARVKAVIAAGLMVAAFAGAYAWRPTVHMADVHGKMNLERLFPRTFGDWVVDEGVPVQLISPDLQAALDKIYNQTLSRTYLNRRSGERIMLSVAYGGDQADGTRAHRPEVCYPAQGFQILANDVASVQAAGQPLRVRQLVAKLGPRVEPITYWIVVGDRVALSGTEQKLAQLRYSTRGIIPDGMLVRVSSIEAQATKAYATQGTFVSDLSQALSPQSRLQILGAGRG